MWPKRLLPSLRFRAPDNVTGGTEKWRGGVVGCEHDMDISGDFSTSVNKNGFKFSIGSNFEVATLFNDFLTLTPMS